MTRSDDSGVQPRSARTPHGQVGTVYLVGAGPGDPELITMRGLRRLREADLVLYDALVHPDQLRECKPGAQRIFVGKRAGRVSERQADINARMIEAARAGCSVVRLKGGDPFLFGRGSEEAEALAAAQIPFEIIPGVPSPVAATAYGGFSLTHRELASSVAYLTATESVEKDRSSHDWSKLATATQTLVIFMGTRKLDTLMQLLIEHGRDAQTPAAVIEWASLPRQRIVTGTVASIAERVREAGLGRPSLTIVGDVLRLRDVLRWFDRRPLFGRRVLVGRPAEQAMGLAQRLRDAGAEPIVEPLLRIEFSTHSDEVRDALSRLHEYDWLVLTSANAVQGFTQALAQHSLDVRALASLRIAVIGERTEATLQSHGLRADLVAAVPRAEGLAEAMLAQVKPGQRALLARAAQARELVPDALRAAGVHVEVLPLYRSAPPTAAEATRLRSRFEAGEVDAVLLTSSVAFEHLQQALGDTAPALLGQTIVVSIGPVTSESVRAHGVTVSAEAEQPSDAGLVEALAAYYENAR